MRKRRGRAWGIAAGLAVSAGAACGGGSSGPGPTAPAPSAVLQLTASPNPVVGDLCGSHCGNLPGEREALTTLAIRETAGVGANATGGSQELRNSATGAVIAQSTFVASDFVRDAGTTRIPPSGQLVFRVGVHYPALHAGVSATFTLTIRAQDDNGHDITVTLAVPTTG